MKEKAHNNRQESKLEHREQIQLHNNSRDQDVLQGSQVTDAVTGGGSRGYEVWGQKQFFSENADLHTVSLTNLVLFSYSRDG